MFCGYMLWNVRNGLIYNIIHPPSRGFPESWHCITFSQEVDLDCSNSLMNLVTSWALYSNVNSGLLAVLVKDDDWLRVNLNCVAMKGGESKGGESGARVCWHSAAIVSDENKWRPVHSQPNEHLLMRSSHCGHTQTVAVSQTNQAAVIVFTSPLYWTTVCSEVQLPQDDCLT